MGRSGWVQRRQDRVARDNRTRATFWGMRMDEELRSRSGRGGARGKPPPGRHHRPTSPETAGGGWGAAAGAGLRPPRPLRSLRLAPPPKTPGGGWVGRSLRRFGRLRAGPFRAGTTGPPPPKLPGEVGVRQLAVRFGQDGAEWWAA